MYMEAKESQENKIGIVEKIQCRNPITENYFNLTMQHIKLFQLIAYQGFMTLQQMDKYFALINKDSKKHISKHTLSRWSASRKGMLSKATKSHHNMYSLNPWMLDWLVDNQFISDNDISKRQRNIHNLLLVESVTNGIYSAWETCMQSDYYQKVQKRLENGFALLAYVRNIKNKQAIKRIIQDNKRISDINALKKDNGLPRWLYGLDLRTYNRQLNITEEQAINLTLKPDALLRFKDTTVYVELDNRNESNFTLVEKIMNYINHAANHPKTKMNLLFIFNDGSLRNDRITQYKVPTSKLSSILQSTIAQQMTFKDNTLQVFKAYQLVPNFHVYLSPLKESYVDFSDILINEGLNDKCIRSLEYWSAHVHPRFHVTYELDKNSKNRYASNTAKGRLMLDNSTKKSPNIQIILGQEHLIDTSISTLIAFNKARTVHAAPFVVLPVRDNAITLSTFKRLIRRNLGTLKQFSFNTVAVIQQTPEYDYKHPMVKVLNHSLAVEQKLIPLNMSLFK